MLIVVMAVVLLLVAKSWKNFGRAAEALPPNPPSGTSAPDATQIQSSMADAKAKTNAHTQKVQEALGD